MLTLFDRMDAEDHEQVVFCADRAAGLKALIAIHDTTLGPALGGIRMRAYASEAEAVTDALRLAQAMTFKAALAGLDYGGGKAVVIGDHTTTQREVLFRALGRAIESLAGRYIPTEDMGTTTADIEWVRKESRFGVGRDEVVEVAEQRRALDVAAECRLTGKQERGRPEDPDEREARSGAQDEPAGAVERAQGREAQPGPEERADERADRLEEDRTDDRASEADQGRVRRVRAAGKDDLCDARPENGAGDDPCDCQRAGDQALPQPHEPGEHHDAEQDPVQPGQPRRG